MAQTYIGQSPGYEQKTHLLQYSSAMPEQVSKHPQIETSMRNSSKGLKPGMSRLEMMKINYEKKLLREKEQRLKEISIQNKERIYSGRTVREFFAERRELEAKAKERKNTTSLPPIDLHFKKMKEQKQRESTSSESSPQADHFKPRAQSNTKKVEAPSKKFNGSLMFSGYSQTHQPHDTASKYPQPKKRTVGIDKQNPLPPLHQGVARAKKPPTPNRRYETHTILTNNDKPDHQVSQTLVKQKKPKGKTLSKKISQTVITSDTASDMSADHDDLNNCWQDESPRPNLSKVKALREKRLSQQKLSVITSSKPKKLTDFQRWQMEQDNARQERLDRYNKENSTDDVDSVVNDDLAQREKELLERINAEKTRLQAIQRQREELDRQERIDKEEEEKWKQRNEKYFKQESKTKLNSKADKEVLHDKPMQENLTTSKPKEVKIVQRQQRKVPSPKHSPEPEEDQVVPGPSTDFYEQKALEAKEQGEASLDLSPCSICGRNFATERLLKHEKVCKQSSEKKRKMFDSRKQRARGQDHEQYVLDGKYKEEPEKKAKKVDWRSQHENFIATIRYAKGETTEAPPPAENPDYEQCPYCERKFNAAAAERHIPKCKDIKSRVILSRKKRR